MENLVPGLIAFGVFVLLVVGVKVLTKGGVGKATDIGTDHTRRQIADAEEEGERLKREGSGE
jgi:hypothetical protein